MGPLLVIVLDLALLRTPPLPLPINFLCRLLPRCVHHHLNGMAAPPSLASQATAASLTITIILLNFWYSWELAILYILGRLNARSQDRSFLSLHMGQFLQGGKNGRLMSYFFFFKSRASAWPNPMRKPHSSNSHLFNICRGCQTKLLLDLWGHLKVP